MLSLLACLKVLFISAPSVCAVQVSKFVEKSVDTENGWTPHVLRQKSGVLLASACSAICLKDSECGSYNFMSDSSTCQLADKLVMCEPVEPSGSGNTTFHLGDEVTAVEMNTLEEKSSWEAEGSSTFDSVLVLAANVLDGTSTTHWSNIGSTGAIASWLQIRIDREAWVKGVSVDVSPNSPERVLYTEIRVGNTDVTGSNEDELLCQNQLCYMIREEEKNNHYSDCVTPLRGQYVTLQHNDLTTNRKFDVGEVNVILYCEAYKIQDQVTCMPVNFDACENRDLINGKTTQTASAESDKSSWALSASSNLDEALFSLSKIVDGDRSGSSPSGIYASLDPETSADKYPWIQIDLRVSMLVKAVHMYSRDDLERGENILYVEVRVGDVNAAKEAQLGSRICVNAVCKTTGGGTALDEQKHDCSGGSPIQGRYITMQRYEYKYDANGKRLYGIIAMAEIDVQFYIN